MVQQRKKSRLFGLSAKPENDLSERMMLGAAPQSIGADLRAARMARGESTADVAHQLRLRESYIEAIETGNFEMLPGVTYAIGFLRSYARYLRIDADDLIQRFKEEVSDIPPPADLAFLEPVSESRVPRGGLVALAILLAIAAYAGWYYLSTRDMTVADLVPAVPEQFAGLVAPTERSDPPPPPMSEQTELAPPGPGGAADTASGTTTEPSSDTTADAGSEDSAPPAPEQLGTDGVAPEPAPGAGGRAIPAVPNVPAADGAVSGEGAGPRVYGEGNVNSRITVRASGDSWIQVRAADETLLMTRTLRAGDSYRVPNQPGLRLMTGNAGALEILVDGQPTPPLGALGAVKRNVLLEPERLKSGAAAN